MPYRETEIEKRYFTIGEVSKEMGVAPSLIRFWEKEFEMINLKKTKKGNRIFTPDDISLLKNIYFLVKEKGHTLEGARKKLRANGPKMMEEADCANRLKTIRSMLVNLRDQI